MTKYWMLMCAICTFLSCKETPLVRGNAKNPPTYKKTDLQKLRWIEGNWKSMVDGPGYYQTISFPTDSTLEVLSYKFDGKDTTNISQTRVYWRNDHLYIGPNGEWVAVLLSKTEFQLDPVREGWNNIIWTQNNKDEWTSVQEKADFIRTIKMKRQPPLESLLKEAPKE